MKPYGFAKSNQLLALRHGFARVERGWPSRRLFLSLISGACTTVLGAVAARAMKLPTSTLGVEILSNERETTRKYSVSSEVTSYLAKVRVRKVLDTDHGLRAGAIIDVRYEVSTFRSSAMSMPEIIGRELKAGDITTLTVFRDGGAFRGSSR